MWGYWFFVAGLVVAAAWSVLLVVRAPAVWRGQRITGSTLGCLVPSGTSRRTYLPFALMVSLFFVRPPPEKPDDYTPYFVAMCADDECDWISDPVGYDQDPDPEAKIRRQAAEHSDHVAEQTRRPLG